MKSLEAINNNPKAIVYLIHGTWARGVFTRKRSIGKSSARYWWTPDGIVFKKLREEFDNNILIRPFDWSGGNSFKERVIASQKLGQELEVNSKEWPNAKIILVGHSHGGTVALMAANTSKKKVTGIITVGTPFIHVMRCKFDNDWGLAPMFGYFLFPLWFLIFLGLTAYLFLYLLPIALLFVFWVFWAYFQGHPDSPYILEHCPSPNLKVRLHCVRTSGDEASLALTASKLISNLTSWIYPACRRLTQWGAKYIFSRRFFLAFTPPLALIFFGINFFEGYADIWSSIIQGITEGIISWALFSALWFGAIYLICLPASIPLGLAFGPELLMSAPIFEVHAESTPQNIQATIEYEQSLNNSLRHSSYKNPVVREKIISKIYSFIADETRFENAK